MKKSLFVFLLCGNFIISNAQTDQKEIAEIIKTVSYYLDGGTNSDSLMFSKAFAPEGQMMFMRNDTMRLVSLKNFMAGAKNTGEKQKRTTMIDGVQVFGNAAQAKLTIEYDTFYFHDMMSLLKTKDGWKIVAKIFYREEKTVKIN